MALIELVYFSSLASSRHQSTNFQRGRFRMSEFKKDENPYASPPPTFESKPIGTVGGNHILASRWKRFGGSIIDGFVMGIVQFAIGIPVSLAIGLTIFDFDPSTQEMIPMDLVETIFMWVVGVFTFLIVNGYLLAKRGQTVGKLAMQTQIVAEDGSGLKPFFPLLLSRYVSIWVVTSIPIIGGIIGLINALLIFRDTKKCLHDDFAGTQVIDFDPSLLEGNDMSMPNHEM